MNRPLVLELVKMSKNGEGNDIELTEEELAHAKIIYGSRWSEAEQARVKRQAEYTKGMDRF